MILKGSQRGGGGQLAAHLLRTDENDHVELHELRGFLAQNLTGALKEAYAISRGTRCKQFLFSLSLSPPQSKAVPIRVFEKAIADIESQLGLAGQPRAVVFHEKEGRRHAHCVWSRIDADTMKAINLPYFKLKLRDVSRQLYIDNDWNLPMGLMNSEEVNPLNFSLAEWQQAKRLKLNPKAIKDVFLDCWATSDGLKAFRNALEARGFYLAKGDRRGFVALDWRGEVYAVGRWCGKRSKEVQAKLGNPADLPSVDMVKSRLVETNERTRLRLKSEAEEHFAQASQGIQAKRDKLLQKQRTERAELKTDQRSRWVEATRIRQARLPHGLKAIWFRLTGRYARIRQQNKAEADLMREKLLGERQAVIEAHLRHRRQLQKEMQQVKRLYEQEMMAIADTFKFGPALRPASADYKPELHH